MQGKAMQDILATKAKRKPPRRPLSNLTNQPSTPVAVAVHGTPPTALPKRPSRAALGAVAAEAKVATRPRPPIVTPAARRPTPPAARWLPAATPPAPAVVEDYHAAATPVPAAEPRPEGDAEAAARELLEGLSPLPNATAQRGVRLAVRAAVLAIVVAASASAGAALIRSAKAPELAPPAPRAPFAWVGTRPRGLRPPRWAPASGVSPLTTPRAAHHDSHARFLAATRGVVHRLAPPSPPRTPVFAHAFRAFPAGPVRRVTPPP